MAPLATLSINLEGTAIGLRPPSQGTNQALPGHAGIFGRLYPNVNLARARRRDPVRAGRRALVLTSLRYAGPQAALSGTADGRLYV